jgi:hypothetical protein
LNLGFDEAVAHSIQHKWGTEFAWLYGYDVCIYSFGVDRMRKVLTMRDLGARCLGEGCAGGGCASAVSSGALIAIMV